LRRGVGREEGLTLDFKAAHPELTRFEEIRWVNPLSQR
jgi:hypothetical protein